jgi:hypothetical protein
MNMSVEFGKEMHIGDVRQTLSAFAVNLLVQQLIGDVRIRLALLVQLKQRSTVELCRTVNEKLQTGEFDVVEEVEHVIVSPPVNASMSVVGRSCASGNGRRRQLE